MILSLKLCCKFLADKRLCAEKKQVRIYHILREAFISEVIHLLSKIKIKCASFKPLYDPLRYTMHSLGIHKNA